MSCCSWSMREVRLETKIDMKIKVKHASDIDKTMEKRMKIGEN